MARYMVRKVDKKPKICDDGFQEFDFLTETPLMDSVRAWKFLEVEIFVPLLDSSSRQALPAMLPPALAAC